MKTIKIYWHYVKINIKSVMQYKVSFLLTALGQFLVSFNVFLGIYFMFLKFHTVKGYTYPQVLLCFGIFLMEFSLAECVGRGFDMFASMVRQGEFDRVLVRPQNEIIQVLGSKFEISRVARMLQAIVMFLYGIKKSRIHWNLWKVLGVFNMLLFGTILFLGIFLIYAAFCFFTLEGLEFMNIFTDGAREYGKYPLDIYGKAIFTITTFAIPYALVQYYPLQYLIGKTQNLLFLCTPFGVIVFFILSVWFWKFGVRHYTSSGS